MGVQSDYASPEKLKTTAPNSYPWYNTIFGTTFVLGPTPKTDQKWPNMEAENRPNFQVRKSNSYTENRLIPTQQAARTAREVQNPYLARRKRWPEEGDLRR